jgi:hypothetical protein
MSLARVCDESKAAFLAFPETVDPGDVELPPELWGDEWDADVWAVTGPDDGPTDEDLADYREMRGEAEARGHLDLSATLSLAELVEHQAAFYRSWPSEAGEMIARELDALALKVRMTDATTPAEFEARIEVLDADIRAGWEARGYDRAMEESGERSACLGHWGHPA